MSCGMIQEILLMIQHLEFIMQKQIGKICF